MPFVSSIRISSLKVAVLVLLLAAPLSAAIGPEHPLTTTMSWLPAAAATDAGFLVAWPSFSDPQPPLVVALLNHEGALQKMTTLAEGGGTGVAMASDGSNTLVSWRAGAYPSTIRRFAWLAPDGTPLGREFDLPDHDNIAIAAGGGRFLIAWSDFSTIRASSIAPLSLEPSPPYVVDIAWTGGPLFLVWSNDRFLVVWHRNVPDTRSASICEPCAIPEIHIRSVRADGTPLAPEVNLGLGSAQAAAPVPGGLLLAWTWNSTHLTQISTTLEVIDRGPLPLLSGIAMASVGGNVIAAGERNAPYQNLYYIPLDTTSTPDERAPGMYLLSSGAAPAAQVQLVSDGTSALAVYTASTTPGPFGPPYATMARSVSASPLPPLPPVPPPPSAVDVSQGIAATVRVGWTPVPGTRVYHADFTAEDAPEEPVHQAIAAPDATSLTFPYLTGDTPYRIDFSTEDAAGIGPPSTTYLRTSVTRKFPRAPDQVEATVVGDHVRLRWRDRSSNELGFRVYSFDRSWKFQLVATLAANTVETEVPRTGGLQRFSVVAFTSEAESIAQSPYGVVVDGGKLRATRH